MNVDIYILEKNGSREIRIPWLPEVIKFESGGTVRATYEIMDRGPVEIPTGSGLRAYSWESELPGRNRRDTSMLRGVWKEPAYYDNIFELWKKNRTPLQLLVLGYPIFTNVILDDYSGQASGAFGDMEYKISFIEDRDIIVNVTKIETTTTAPAEKRPAVEADTYTIKSGDTLWSIAQRFYKAGAKWETIYNANKDIIESTAKKRWKAVGIDRDSQRGHWIFPGTVITIP